MAFSKKGVELSINFIVIIVISVVIFAGGIVLANKMFSGAESVLEQMDSQSIARIEQLLDDGARVAMPFKSQKISRGESKVFGVGILNVENSETDFKIDVQFVEAFDENNNEICPSSNPPTFCANIASWILHDSSTHTIQSHDKEMFRIHIKPVDGAAIGTYIFDVTVDYDPAHSGTMKSYDPKRKILVHVV